MLEKVVPSRRECQHFKMLSLVKISLIPTKTLTIWFTTTIQVPYIA